MTSTPLAVPPSSAELALAVRQNASGIVRALRYLGVRPKDVVEVAKDVFVALQFALVTGEERLPLRTLAYRAAVQVASDHRKRSYRRPPPERASAVTAWPAQQERVGRLDQALAQLAPVHREVFVLVELEQLPPEELAAALGVPEKTASSRLHAARVALRDAWGDTSHGEPRAMSDASERGSVEALPAALAAALHDARCEVPSEPEIARIEAGVLAAITDGGAAAARARSEAAHEASAAGTPVSGGGVLAATLVGLAVLGVAWWNYDLGRPRAERAREVRETVETRGRGADAGPEDGDADSPAPPDESRAAMRPSPSTE